MAIIPNVTDKNREAELKRMAKIADGPDGRERMKSEFNIDVTKGDGFKKPANTGKKS